MVSSSSERMSTFSMTGIDERAAALDDAEAARAHGAVRVRVAVFAAGDDQHFVRADLGVAAGPDRREDHDDDHQADDHHGDSSDAAETCLGQKYGVIWHSC